MAGRGLSVWAPTALTDHRCPRAILVLAAADVRRCHEDAFAELSQGALPRMGMQMGQMGQMGQGAWGGMGMGMGQHQVPGMGQGMGQQPAGAWGGGGQGYGQDMGGHMAGSHMRRG